MSCSLWVACSHPSLCIASSSEGNQPGSLVFSLFEIALYVFVVPGSLKISVLSHVSVKESLVVLREGEGHKSGGA